jgi:hypothetical protein
MEARGEQLDPTYYRGKIPFDWKFLEAVIAFIPVVNK